MKKMLFLLCLTLNGLLAIAQPQWVPFTQTVPTAPNFTLNTSSSTSVSFSVEVGGMHSETITHEGSVYNRVSIAGATTLSSTGSPELPSLTYMVAIPECSEVQLAYTIGSQGSLSSYNIYPMPDYEGVTNPDSTVYVREIFSKDQSAYSKNEYIPAVSVTIASQGYLRNQKYAEVVFNPLAFNPTTGHIAVAQQVEVTLTFTNPTTDVNVNTGIFNNVAASTFINYVSNGVSAVINDRAATPGTVQWVTLQSVAQASQIVADYLIITSAPFFDPEDSNSQLLRIAQHRASYNGFDVAIVNVENVISHFVIQGEDKKNERAIRRFTKAVYNGTHAAHTLDGKLGYVLLVGDWVEGSTDNTGMPTSYDHPYFWSDVNTPPTTYPSDYYFTCVTTEANGTYDELGDLFIGRFCVENNTNYGAIQLFNIVEKTIFFETEFVPERINNVNFINGGFAAVDWWNNYLDNKYYPYVQSLIHNENITIVNMLKMNPSNPNQQFRDEFYQMSNNGAKLIMYLGHGGVTSWSGGLVSSSIIERLDNPFKCPIGISTACQTGWFDDPEQKCMTEELTTYSSSKGFTGMYGMGRSIDGNLWTPSPPPYIPPSLQLFIPFSIWYDHSYVIGETILKSKVSRNIYRFSGNYFGDPALNIMASGYRISKNRTLKNEVKIDSYITITQGATLTLDEGATINFTESGGLNVENGSSIIVKDNVTLNSSNGTHNINISGELVVNGNCTTDVNFLVNKSGKLTLNNKTMQFGSNTDIVIKPGAVLETNGGKLTSKLENATWRGVIVEGNPSLPQTPTSNQGYLYLGAGTVVEHLDLGVSATNGIGSKTGGGIIQVNGATFTDNLTAIRFDAYRSGSLPNQSYIYNSTFTTTAYLQQNGLVPQAHVTLYGASQVKIMGNTFLNTAPSLYDYNSRGFGVNASNSDVYVANFCERIPCDTGTPNTFSGLTVGVQSVGADAVPALLVEKAAFSDCFTGVSVNGIASPVIQSCLFQVPDYSYNNTVSSAITLNVASAFTLKANTITGAATGGTGISLYNLSQTAGSIEGNSFSSLRYGVVADGMGKANLTCNTFELNATDVYLLGEGISRIQGSPKVSASNRFLTMCGDVNQFHIQSPFVPITYYGHSSSTVYSPMCNEGNVYVFGAEALANCGDDFDGEGIEGMEAYSDTITVKQAELTELEDEGCTDNLMLAVENAVPGSNPVPLMRKLINASPVLSDAVMVAATNRYEVLPDAFLTSVLASNPQAPKSAAVTSAMGMRPSPLPDYFLQAINESGNELSEIDIAKGNIEGLIGTRDIMLASMAGRMLNDTIIKETDTLTMAINLMPTATTIALKALLQLEKGEQAECMETLTVGMGQVSNSLEATELEGFSEFLAQVIQTDPSDTTYTDMMSGFAESPNVLVSLLAKNALLAANSTPIHAPFIEFDPTVVPRSSAAPASPTVSVTPEKATDYVVIKYNLFRVKPSEVQIAITDNNGINSWSYSPRVKAFEEIVVTEGWAAGNYTVNLSQDNKVIASTSFSIGATDEVTPFAENMEGKAFNISPNPAKSTVTISLTEKYASSSFSYVLLNSKGEPFKKGNSTGSVSVSIDRLMPAIYLVKVTVNGKEFTETLVKE